MIRYELVVEELFSPVRIDRFLGDAPQIPATRSKIQRALKEGNVLVDGKVAQASHKLSGGERIELELDVPKDSGVAPEAESIPIDVVFEDDHLLIVNKPAGMVTHPAAGARSGTLVNALLGRGASLSDLYGQERAGIVHRLDKNTTGLLVVAKNEESHLELQRQLQRRDLQRSYLALICGHLKEQQGVIDAPIGRSIRDRKKMAVTGVSSREALTRFALRERFKSYDLLDVQLETGRTHQIRVHFSHLGHPVFGDPDYGGREGWHKGLFGPERQFGLKALGSFQRQALHAGRIVLTHPVTGRRIELETEPPADFQELLEKVRSRH
ncbi:MAG: RluA family pseudouridine synthase [Candidatus Zixiibacteriota bacterium]